MLILEQKSVELKGNTWRGGRAVECGGLENRYSERSESRVRIPPSPPVCLSKINYQQNGLNLYTYTALQLIPAAHQQQLPVAYVYVWMHNFLLLSLLLDKYHENRQSEI